jgi:hypothetical protein
MIFFEISGAKMLCEVAVYGTFEIGRVVGKEVCDQH